MGGKKRSGVMNTIRFIVAWILCVASVLIAGWFIGRMSSPATGEIQFHRFLTVAFFFILAAAFFALAEYFRKSVKWLPQTPDRRPIVRVWTHNDVTAVDTEEDYQHWWQEHQIYESLSGLIAMPVPHATNRPAPRFTMFFSHKSLTPEGWDHQLWSPDDWRTGDDRDLARLLAGCRAERAELFVPNNSFQWRQGFTTPVSLKAAWKLVHNKEMPE
ncbi:MAG: hypothetical protein A2431_03690 [Candidatus Zambryskibacteria bacterium RIFOXYC1_FULL_39_10]|uniref:Uncharacterized protein n=1 Tax=Candidatus Zambryskibacteria bacterium RIFOXYC1_FULL_39_10 TaxID=1802779 RepID=A0A1G2V2U6_9BACT|nr:MAG: hypothetical protein A2431_03690 [Candidatus Zambryskibacteria bacterium RIFOXYC1_FULL_39_10]OHB16642.1 MAG: hypothetical protein A2605_00585 [Candidatus Zambryskibacteria bacterium RIFOXYD1_FULL_39_35]